MKTLNSAPVKKMGNWFPLYAGILGVAILSLFLTPACHTTKKTQAPHQKVEVISDQDSTTYELIVLNPSFESYLATQPPANFHSQQYFETWNYQYVLEWNQRYRSPLRYGSFYDTKINYDPQEDYGLELNYRLYYYFQFIKEKYGIELINRGR